MTLRERLQPLIGAPEYSEFETLWTQLNEDTQLQWPSSKRLMELGAGMRRQLRVITNDHAIDLILGDRLRTTEASLDVAKREVDALVRVLLPVLAEYGDWAERILRPSLSTSVEV